MCYAPQPNTCYFLVINEKPLPSVYQMIFYYLGHASAACITINQCRILSNKRKILRPISASNCGQFCQSNVKHSARLAASRLLQLQRNHQKRIKRKRLMSVLLTFQYLLLCKPLGPYPVVCSTSLHEAGRHQVSFKPYGYSH